MYATILVPTDGSSEGTTAVRHAVDLAAIHEATVRVVHVVNTAGYRGLPMETAWSGVAEALRTEGEEAVERAAELAPPSVPVETAVLEGPPGRRIVEEAGDAGADLIVMATHGRGGIDRLLLGSVAEWVVRKAPVPVLTVPIEGTDA